MLKIRRLFTDFGFVIKINLIIWLLKLIHSIQTEKHCQLRSSHEYLSGQGVVKNLQVARSFFALFSLLSPIRPSSINPFWISQLLNHIYYNSNSPPMSWLEVYTFGSSLFHSLQNSLKTSEIHFLFSNWNLEDFVYPSYLIFKSRQSRFSTSDLVGNLFSFSSLAYNKVLIELRSRECMLYHPPASYDIILSFWTIRGTESNCGGCRTDVILIIVSSRNFFVIYKVQAFLVHLVLIELFLLFLLLLLLKCLHSVNNWVS